MPAFSQFMRFPEAVMSESGPSRCASLPAFSLQPAKFFYLANFIAAGGKIFRLSALHEFYQRACVASTVDPQLSWAMPTMRYWLQMQPRSRTSTLIVGGLILGLVTLAVYHTWAQSPAVQPGGPNVGNPVIGGPAPAQPMPTDVQPAATQSAPQMVLQTYGVPAASLVDTVTKLQSQFAGNANVRIAGDSRTSQVLVFASAE